MSEAFRDPQLLSSQYNTPVLVDNRVIGINGREDSAPASLRAIAPMQKQVLWEQPGLGTAHLTAVGNQVLLTSVKGRIMLLDGSSPSFTVLTQGTLSGTHFALCRRFQEIPWSYAIPSMAKTASASLCA